uniref:Microtubule-associated protein Jupiter n=1 Tax=Riptortus pedestris TaxID=329032 RepID=R4WRF0_RIPPE|nr:unkown protein [Riptortus pedestris]
MATYAAYRHIELDKVGYGKKRVLKPPGGGSSDIFGTGGSQQDGNTPRRVKNHQHSNLFLNDDPAPTNTPSRNHDGQTNGENGHAEEGGQENLRNGNAAPMNGNGNAATQAPAQARARVPPGGFSSGLW